MTKHLSFRAYNIITAALEEGIRYGVNRAYKYTESPDRETIVDQVHTAVMNSLCEVLDFGESDE